jgi:hypothetical protein
MTDITCRQCAVEQPQSCTIPFESVGIDTDPEIDRLFFNALAESTDETVRSNSVDSWERFGQYGDGEMRELGSRT